MSPFWGGAGERPSVLALGWHMEKQPWGLGLGLGLDLGLGLGALHGAGCACASDGLW